MAAKLIELDSRELADGSAISITLFRREGTEEFIVEAQNEKWAASILVTGEALGWEAYMHPFSREGWMDYPGINDTGDTRLRPLSEDEYAILEAIESAKGVEVA